MADSSDTLVAHTASVRLGERVGWTDARRAEVRAQSTKFSAGSQAFMALTELAKPYSGHSIHHLKSYFDTVSERGEPEALMALAPARPASAPR
jgi:hypothetical protein